MKSLRKLWHSFWMDWHNDKWFRAEAYESRYHTDRYTYHAKKLNELL